MTVDAILIHKFGMFLFDEFPEKWKCVDESDAHSFQNFCKTVIAISQQYWCVKHCCIVIVTNEYCAHRFVFSLIVRSKYFVNFGMVACRETVSTSRFSLNNLRLPLTNFNRKFVYSRCLFVNRLAKFGFFTQGSPGALKVFANLRL